MIAITLADNSPLTQCTFKEKYEKKTLKRLINSRLTSERTYRQLGRTDDDDLHIADLCEKTHLTNILKSISSGFLKTTYNFSKRTKVGRVYVKNSQGFIAIRRHLRNVIASSRYVDIDMENAHSSIITQLFEDECKLEILPDFVSNRQKYFDELKEFFNLQDIFDLETNDITTVKDICKKYMSAVIYGSGYDRLSLIVGISSKSAHPWFIHRLKDEMNRIYNYTLEKNPWLNNFKKNKKEERGIHALFSLYIQEYERRVLECAFDVICSKGIWSKTGSNEGSLCYDGLMILKSIYDQYPTLIADIQDNIKNTLGLNIKFVEKPMPVPESTVEILNSITIDTVSLPDDYILPDETDKRYAEIVHHHNKDSLLYQTSKWYALHPTTKIWTQKESVITVISNTLLDHVEKYFEWRRDQEDFADSEEKIFKFMRIRVGSSAGCKAVENFLKDYCEPESPIFFDEIPHILAFPDGTCYDLNRRQFTPILPEYKVSKTCKVSLNQAEYDSFFDNDEKMSHLIKVLTDTFDSCGESDNNRIDYCFQMLSNILYGGNQAETYQEWVGRGGNGKSNLTCLFQSSLGSYVRSISPDQFTKVKQDPTSANSAVVDCMGARLVISSEPSATDKVQSAIIKQWSGRDPIKARRLRENEIEFKSTFKLIIQSNNTLEFDKNGNDKGIQRRRRIIRFEKSYISQLDFDKKTQDNTLLPWERVGDSSLKTKFETDDYAKRFIAFLINKYITLKDPIPVPFDFADEVAEVFEEENPISWFIEKHCKRGNESSVVPAGRFYQYYKDMCMEECVRSVSSNTFGIKMKMLFGYKRTIKIRLYSGIIAEGFQNWIEKQTTPDPLN